MDGRANTDALKAALRGCSKTRRQEAAGGGRQWLGGGGGGGGLVGAGWVAGGAGGVVDLFFSCVRPCDHAATISSNSVPQIQFIDSGWLFLFRDGYSQCKL